VPVDVKGPWHDISYTPDLTAMLGDVVKDPGKALESIKGLIPGMGGSSSGTTTTSPEKPATSPLDSIRGLFGR
jgi:hypothetical protein